MVYAGDELRLGELGLWPLGDLEQLVRHYPNDEDISDWGVDVNIAVLDFTVTDAATTDEGGVLFTLGQSNTPYTSWHIGQFRTQTSVFVSVLEAVGNVSFHCISNRTWQSPSFGQAQLGQGWQHYAGSQEGFGGFDYSYFLSPVRETGRVKVAIALPYSGFEDHQGIPLWAGSVGYFDRDDTDAQQADLG